MKTFALALVMGLSLSTANHRPVVTNLPSAHGHDCADHHDSEPAFVTACQYFPGPPPGFYDPEQQETMRRISAKMRAEYGIQGNPPAGGTQAPANPAPAAKQTPEEKFQQELDADKRLGKEASDYYDRMYQPSKNLNAYERVKRMGEELALIANSNPIEVYWGDKRFAEFEYKFKLVESKDINAFSLPGGYIYVYEGLVDFCQSDDELAGVLAHEITHAAQRHVAFLNKESSKANQFTIPLILASIFTGGAAMGAMGAMTGSLATTALRNGWSQRAEQSADYGGFQYMVMSQYDPTGMMTFMERLRLQDFLYSGAEVGIFRTHPPSKFRAEMIEGYMRKNSIPIRRSKVTTLFRTTVKELADGTQQVMFGRKKLFVFPPDADAKKRAEETVKRMNIFMDRVPDMFEVQEGENGIIYGQNRLLVQFHQKDADALKVPLEKLQNDAVRAIKDSIFSLATHAWDR